ncbi:MAG: biotin--[acetyl-CoA-carboxylase] ligase [Lachnospiraceae bacterium]|nr:biotin--[acetyl-CoA-carboxylase] ligase [Lachnospiraceae bacterium]
MLEPTYIYHESIDSTNNEIKRLAEDGSAAEFTVVSAGEQTAGRGRSGHVWQSPPGTSIATSILLRPAGVDFDRIPRITILSALAVADAAEEATGLTCGIKWPNDVLLNKRKICGILTELCFDRDRNPYMVVGIGVNVTVKDFPPDIADMATSLMLASGKPAEAFSRKAITEKIWDRFLVYYEGFLKTGDLSEIRVPYEDRLVNVNERVRVLDPLGEYEARATGIDNGGRLLVVKDNGTCAAIDSGEVSVRGIYGYA